MAQIIDMPKLSDTMTVGTLVKWLKNEGDAVKSGDMLAEVETDKATMELESFFDGTLLKQFMPPAPRLKSAPRSAPSASPARRSTLLPPPRKPRPLPPCQRRLRLQPW